MRSVHPDGCSIQMGSAACPACLFFRGQPLVSNRDTETQPLPDTDLRRGPRRWNDCHRLARRSRRSASAAGISIPARMVGCRGCVPSRFPDLWVDRGSKRHGVGQIASENGASAFRVDPAGGSLPAPSVSQVFRSARCGASRVAGRSGNTFFQQEARSDFRLGLSHSGRRAVSRIGSQSGLRMDGQSARFHPLALLGRGRWVDGDEPLALRFRRAAPDRIRDTQSWESWHWESGAADLSGDAIQVPCARVSKVTAGSDPDCARSWLIARTCSWTLPAPRRDTCTSFRERHSPE